MNEVMVLLLLTGVVLVGILIWACAIALRAASKNQQAHTERGSAKPTRLVAPTPPPTIVQEITRSTATSRPSISKPTAPPSPEKGKQSPAIQGKIRARVIYVKADGSRSERDLTLYSCVISEGVVHSVNVRQDGHTITKTFLVSGFERLQILDASPALILENPRDIRDWVAANLPIKAFQGEERPPKISVEQIPQLARTAPTSSSRASTASAAKPLHALLPQGAKGFAVFDLETTGKNTAECLIVEIGLVCVDPSGEITEVWESLVKPACEIPTKATEIHRIRDTDVKRAPSFSEVSPLFAAKIDQHVLVAHNLSYDLPILERHFRDHSDLQIDLGSGLCTLRGFRGDPADSFRKKLANLCAFHGVDFNQRLAHTAIGDAMPLARALIKGMSHLEPSTSPVKVLTTLNLSASAQALTRGMIQSLPEASWDCILLQLKPGLIFATTGPRSTSVDTPIRRSKAHAKALGLQGIKVNSFSKKDPPDFLLSTSLDLVNTKMMQARERGIPIVLIEEINKLRCLDLPVEAWIVGG
ncbi:3'-5' exonuclease [Synechococcus sp. CCAP 1479/13]|uniref:3'-5' exonuclease n=1 Tax=Synechococcus sp. CCAP 1479/13 TaxID=1221595 RepID=UPI001C251148